MERVKINCLQVRNESFINPLVYRMNGQEVVHHCQYKACPDFVSQVTHFKLDGS